MAIAKSKITSQGQISVPAEVRRRLGVGPGSFLEWNEEDGRLVVRKAGGYTSAEIRKILFPNGPPRRRSLAELKEAISEDMRSRYARR